MTPDHRPGVLPPTIVPGGGTRLGISVRPRVLWVAEFIRAVFRANFARDLDISSPDVVRDCLASGPVDADGVMHAAVSDDAKLELRAQTEAAVERGIFGAPTFIVHEEMFWGNDRLEVALEWAVSHRA